MGISGLLSEECSESVFFCTVCFALHDNTSGQQKFHRFALQDLNIRVQNIYSSQNLERIKLKWNEGLNLSKEKGERLLGRENSSYEPPETDSIYLHEELTISAYNTADINFIYCELYLCEENLGPCSLFPKVMSQPFSLLLFSDMCSNLNLFMRWIFAQGDILLENGWKRGALFSNLSKVVLIRDFLQYLSEHKVFNLRMIAIVAHLKTAVQVAFNFYHSSLEKKKGLVNTYNMLYFRQCELNSILRDSRG